MPDANEIKQIPGIISRVNPREQEKMGGDFASPSSAPVDSSDAGNVRKLPNNLSAETENKERWNELIQIKQGGNGQFYLEIDPNLMAEEVVRKFWRENATKVGTPIDLNLLEKIIEWIKALLNAIIKAVTKKENFFKTAGGQHMRIQNPSLEGAMHLRALLIDEVKAQGDALSRNLKAYGLVDQNDSMQVDNALKSSIEQKIDLINTKGATIDFTDMSRTEVSEYIDSLEEHVSRSIAAEKQLAQELMKNPAAMAMLINEHSSVFDGQPKAVSKVLEDLSLGLSVDIKKSQANEIQKLVLKAYELQEHAELNGVSKSPLSDFFGDETDDPLIKAIGIREALRVRDSRFSLENIRRLEIKLDQESEVFQGKFAEKVQKSRAEIEIPHYLSSVEEKRWLKRRKDDISEGIFASQPFVAPEKSSSDPNKVKVDQSPVLDLNSEVKPVESVAVKTTSHQQLFDRLIDEPFAIDHVLSLPLEEKAEVYEAIRQEAYLNNELDLSVSPFDPIDAETDEEIDRIILERKELFRQCFAGPAIDSAESSGMNRSPYELFVYRAGLAMFEELRPASAKGKEDYSKLYESARSEVNETDRSYVREKSALNM